ncbi:MAG TPA: hypothetical protein DCM40_30685 [Maribacter sp.]|nr:MAG: hypothetical protein Tp158DCM1229571_35 [Prokaryotic dsDNA virus sp.]HAI42173.1 hypothetical protein [Maribacter sp.]|tara:strand:- start:141 stop:344 length:204 start_codon:yes stop_codon:yes gene_type:complete
MADKNWVRPHIAEEVLGINRKELFKMRDDGTFKLGPHYAAFPETRSRDTYRWNIKNVQKTLQEQEVA